MKNIRESHFLSELSIIIRDVAQKSINGQAPNRKNFLTRLLIGKNEKIETPKKDLETFDGTFSFPPGGIGFHGTTANKIASIVREGLNSPKYGGHPTYYTLVTNNETKTPNRSDELILAKHILPVAEFAIRRLINEMQFLPIHSWGENLIAYMPSILLLTSDQVGKESYLLDSIQGKSGWGSYDEIMTKAINTPLPAELIHPIALDYSQFTDLLEESKQYAHSWVERVKTSGIEVEDFYELIFNVKEILEPDEYNDIIYSKYDNNLSQAMIVEILEKIPDENLLHFKILQHFRNKLKFVLFELVRKVVIQRFGNSS